MSQYSGHSDILCTSGYLTYRPRLHVINPFMNERFSRALSLWMHIFSVCRLSAPKLHIHTHAAIVYTLVTQRAFNSHDSRPTIACPDGEKASLPEMVALQGERTLISQPICAKEGKAQALPSFPGYRGYPDTAMLSACTLQVHLPLSRPFRSQPRTLPKV